MSGPLGVAVVGLGVGEQHARAFARDERTRVRWVLDRVPERMERTIAAIGQGRAASSFEAVLEDPAVELVAIATYDDQHAAQVVAALEAGKHVFCEKPLCRTREELAAIQRALAGNSKRQLACNLVLRAAPMYSWLRAAIRGGDLGEVYAVDADYLYGRIEKLTEGWRGHVGDYSVLQGGGVHMLDLLLWLVGRLPVRVSAVGNKSATTGTPFRYPDFVAATYQFASGLVGRVTANFACMHRHHHVLRVFGTRATFIYDDAGARLHRTRDPGVSAVPVSEPPLPASKGDLIPAFIDRIVAGGDGRVESRHELDLMAACLAADAALANRQTLAIEYVS